MTNTKIRVGNKIKLGFGVPSGGVVRFKAKVVKLENDHSSWVYIPKQIREMWWSTYTHKFYLFPNDYLSELVA